MTAMQKQLVVSMSDLRYLCVQCGGCKNRIIIDLEGIETSLPHCAVCHAEFDLISVGNNVTAIRDAYRQQKSTKHKLSFCLPIESGPAE